MGVQINTEDTTVLNWFDFKEIHPVYLEIADMTPVRGCHCTCRVMCQLAIALLSTYHRSQRQRTVTSLLSHVSLGFTHTCMHTNDCLQEDVLKKIRNVLPSPRNYGPTAAEQAECSARAAEQQAVAEAEVGGAHTALHGDTLRGVCVCARWLPV